MKRERDNLELDQKTDNTKAKKPEISLSVSFKNGKGESRFEKIRTITEEEYENIDKALKEQDDIEQNEKIFKIISGNYTSILKFYLEEKKRLKNTRTITWLYAGKVSLELGRLLLNYLASIKLFLEFNKTNFEKKSPECFEEFERIRREAYDNTFGFRFLSKLRDYVQHCGLPILSVGIEVTNPAEIDHKAVRSEFEVSINKEGLLKASFNWTSKIRKEIEAGPENVDLISVLKGTESEINRIYRITDHLHKKIYINSAVILYSLNEEFRESGIRGTPCITIIEAMPTNEENVRLFNLEVRPIPIIIVSK